MGLHAQVTLISHDEYLEGELRSEVKHEYVAGHVYAMAGTSRIHNRIALNCSYLLQTGLNNTPCDVYVSDVKVRVAAADAFYYPDVVVGCESKDNNQYYLTQPKIIIEVLSPSTERVDKTEKLLSYKSIDSLQEYMIVAQDKCEIMLYQRVNNWDLSIFGKNDKFVLESVDLEIVVNDIYARTEL
ncbi:Uma2 family endonuclease [Candidatus Albibeggiatoa sp. nov. NOAA]|uniref:Uma2 family endonuclease n=1 Tax=Candidatus Albibeggiatoa sp. nov. NOAA TaxID=3162724 RepID=UPI0033010A8C|nr:Uma2 family endonuclease [Thiotrichaceae bacterium]